MNLEQIRKTLNENTSNLYENMICHMKNNSGNEYLLKVWFECDDTNYSEKRIEANSFLLNQYKIVAYHQDNNTYRGEQYKARLALWGIKRLHDFLNRAKDVKWFPAMKFIPTPEKDWNMFYCWTDDKSILSAVRLTFKEMEHFPIPEGYLKAAIELVESLSINGVVLRDNQEILKKSLIVLAAEYYGVQVMPEYNAFENRILNNYV